MHDEDRAQAKLGRGTLMIDLEGVSPGHPRPSHVSALLRTTNVTCVVVGYCSRIVEKMTILSPYFGGRTKLQKFLRVLLFIVLLIALMFALISLTYDATARVLGRSREFGAWWFLSAVPFIASSAAWVGMVRHRKLVPGLPTTIVGLLVTTAAVLLSLAEIGYVHFVRDLSWQEGGGIWGFTLLLSAFGFVSGLYAVTAPRWFSVLALATSTWMLVFSFLSGIAI
jgi:hypothetical protein